MKNEDAAIKEILENAVYKKIIEESHGGICYMNAPSDYDTKELLALFEKVRDYEIDGIIRGCLDFIREG